MLPKEIVTSKSRLLRESSASEKRNCQSPGVLMLPGPARTTL
jgi:hypothetical protein